MHLSVVQRFEILSEMLFEFDDRFLYLLLFLQHDVRVLQIFRSHVRYLREELHVLSQLQAHQVAEGEQRLVIQVTHELILAVGLQLSFLQQKVLLVLFEQLLLLQQQLILGIYQLVVVICH